MKKDYIPVTNSESSKSETAFVEEFWTHIWDKHNVNRDSVIGEIERQEEFRLMNPYISNLPPKSRILDGGCGLGKWTLYWSKRGFEVVGLDISKATIEKLKERFPEHNFICGDIRYTGFDDESFDAYFSWGVFEHFEIGLGPCFKEANRILKKGGYLFVSVPFQNGRHLRRDKYELSKWDENFDREKGYVREMRFYQWRLTKPELQREFELNGFKILKVEAIAKEHGLYRAIKHDLGIEPGTKLHKKMMSLLYPFVPKDYVAHMIMGIGQKR